MAKKRKRAKKVSKGERRSIAKPFGKPPAAYGVPKIKNRLSTASPD